MKNTNFTLNGGDIFLYHGTHIISKLIRIFDGTEVNHASLYIGNNQVIEAKEGSSGVSKNDIYESIKDSSYIKVFRLHDEIEIKPVIDIANRFYLSPNRYGYEQILLLAFIIIIRKAMPTKAFKWIAKTILENAVEILLKLTQQKREVLICSELVFRSYEEPYPGILEIAKQSSLKGNNNLPANVHPESLYALFSNPSSKIINENIKIKNIENSKTIEEINLELENKLKDAIKYLNNEDTKDIPDITIQEIENAFWQFVNELNKHYKVDENINIALLTRNRSLTIANLNRVIADFVTPGDLYKSPALKYIGKIKI